MELHFAAPLKLGSYCCADTKLRNATQGHALAGASLRKCLSDKGYGRFRAWRRDLVRRLHGRAGMPVFTPRLSAGRFPDLARRSGSRSGAIRAVSLPGPVGSRSVAACVASVFLLLQAPGCVQQRCYEELDCQPPAVCGFTGVCVWQCSTAADCGPGFACLDNLCTPTATGAVSCSDDMVPVASAYCVDRYEASRNVSRTL